MAKYIYVASQDVEGGIARYTLSQEGKLDLVDFLPLDRPCFLAAQENQIHAILREPFRMQSGVVFSLDPSYANREPEQARIFNQNLNYLILIHWHRTADMSWLSSQIC